MGSDRVEDVFAQGAFWDSYARSWDDDVKPNIDGEVLGEEWGTPNQAEGILSRFAEPYLESSDRVVEIGPGGGKFSRQLVRRCNELILVDVSSEMLGRANRACGGEARELLIADGSLQPLGDASVDFVFSYDVLLHVESEELFRYMAEVNRILRPGGVFSMHTSTYESGLGMYAYLQQLRDNLGRIGTRYGGRMYPLSDGIVRRFAEHSGFSIADAHATADDKNLVYALRKSRPARPWRFVTDPQLGSCYGLAQRLGGSDRRELYLAQDRETGRWPILGVGDARDPWLLSAAKTDVVPRHRCLVGAEGIETLGGLTLVRYPEARARPFAWTSAPEPGRRLAALCEGLLEAHHAGLAHGEIGVRHILETDGDPRLFGLLEPPAAERSTLVRADLAAAGTLLTELTAAGLFGDSELSEVALKLSREPEPEDLRRAIVRLRAGVVEA